MGVLKHALLGVVVWAAVLGYPGWLYVKSQDRIQTTVYIFRDRSQLLPEPSRYPASDGVVVYRFPADGVVIGSSSTGGAVTLAGGSAWVSSYGTTAGGVDYWISSH